MFRRAVWDNDLEKVGAIVAAGADPNSVDQQFSSRPLNDAKTGDMALLLLHLGADPTLPGGVCGLPLHDAAYDGNTDVVRVLLDAGVPVNLRAGDDYTALTHAAAQGQLATATLLLDRGADPNAARDHGYTVLMSAVSGSSRTPDVVRLLLARGANPHAVSEYGYNAFHAATDCDFDLDEGTRLAIYRLLKDAGCDLEARNNSGQTPLLRAVICGDAEEAFDLLEIGADPNARVDSCRHVLMSDGGTLLHYSYYTEAMLRVFERAIAAGARIDAVDGEGRTPIDRLSNDCEEVEPWLRERFVSILSTRRS